MPVCYKSECFFVTFYYKKYRGAMKTIIFKQYVQFVKLKWKDTLNIIRVTKGFDSFNKGAKRHENEKKKVYSFIIKRMYGSGNACRLR